MADDEAGTVAGTNPPDDDGARTRSRGLRGQPTPEELDRRQAEMGSVRKPDGPADVDMDADAAGRGVARPADVPETGVPTAPGD
jgi:hypothetical protein